MDKAITHVPGHEPIEMVAYYESFTDYYPYCELQTKRWFVETAQPDWTIFDIGANVGYYSILMSRLCPQGQIHSFEPTSTIELLKKNVAHHGRTNITPHQIALGARSGRHEDGIFRIWGKDAEKQEYDFLTLDDAVKRLNVKRLDCIKIDVDSFDFEVLRGAENTLRKFNPWVVVELNHALDKRGQSANEALEWLVSQGFRNALVLDHENFVLRRADAPAPATGGLSLSFEQRPIFIESQFKKDRPLPEFFKPAPQSHNDGKVSGKLGTAEGVTLDLIAPRWSYGLSFVRSTGYADLKEPIVVEVELEVKTGSLGIGCVGEDYSTYAGVEVAVKASGGTQKISLAVPKPELLHAIVFRNVDEFETSATARIIDIRAFTGNTVVTSSTAFALRNDISTLTQGDLKRMVSIPAEPAAADVTIDIVPSETLGSYLGYAENFITPFKTYYRPLSSFKMEIDDAPILKYLYRNAQPKRHLEFGTWQGFGATLCADACDAEIWTLNLPEGERSQSGEMVYSSGQDASDSGDMIGWMYRAAGHGARVHQILADSQQWDTSGFEAGFFDSVLVDGGHTPDVVKNDTEKSLPLLRSGGMMLWHDFCPDQDTVEALSASRGVVTGVTENLAAWAPHFSKLFWIRPSFLLIGIKA
ncbi:FkbM family methyltransferase [Tardiphaga sp. 709]|jgi:FkbM family methyltransferase|uniref:class I SAM-dependent methyltransferase n=1 Tax=Tardiphaga sp. 709 TaxID=3076039 RepID=UPI0028F02114|nr:FkbM family methyltransferase [Tardiphaga sp. 709]WNV09173.1 FkbM family methyltransferase [Tardiphaga sp. 709]